jgi:hypothetical protein
LAESPSDVIATTYYPGVPTTATATEISVGSGEERTGVNLVAMPTTATSVTGAYTLPGGDADSELATRWLRIVLLPDGEVGGNTVEVPSVATEVPLASSGTFQLSAVPAGRYRLRALSMDTRGRETVEAAPSGGVRRRIASPGMRRLAAETPQRPTYWAEKTVAVERDEVQVSVSLQIGSRLGGRVIMDGAAASAVPVGAPIHVKPSDGRAVDALPITRLQEDGTFLTPGLPPGKYSLLLAVPPPLGVTSVHAGGQLRPDAAVELSSFDVRDIVLELGRPPQIRGRVSLREPAPAIEDVSVYVFPTDARLWTRSALLAGLLAEARPGRDGSYLLSPSRPGAYYVVATNRGQPFWHEPAALRLLMATATTVDLRSGQSTKSVLKNPRSA